VLDGEPMGPLLSDRGTALSGEIAATGDGRIVAAWVETRSADPSSKSLYAQALDVE